MPDYSRRQSSPRHASATETGPTPGSTWTDHRRGLTPALASHRGPCGPFGTSSCVARQHRLLIGLLCGAPYGRAIHRNAPAHTVHSWGVAHASLPMGAIPMFAAAALLSSFAVAAQVQWCMAVALTVSGYAFCVSPPLAARSGDRGLSSRGPLTAKLVFAGNALGAIAPLAASSPLVYAADVSLCVTTQRRSHRSSIRRSQVRCRGPYREQAIPPTLPADRLLRRRLSSNVVPP